MQTQKSTAAVLIVGNTQESADLRYVAGYRTSDPIVYVRVAGGGHLVVSAMDKAWATQCAQGVTVWSPRDLALSKAMSRRLSDWAFALLHKLGVRRAQVPANFPLAVARRLERRGVRLDVAAQGVFPQRRVKTADEVARIRMAQRAAVAGMHAAWALLRAATVDARGVLRHAGRSLACEQVRRAINMAAMAHDCVGGDPIVACGEQSANPHGIGRGPLRAGEPIVIDIFPQHAFNGYWGDLTRTVCKGTPKPGLRALHTAVAAAQRLALATVRAAISGSTVHRIVHAEFERRGYKTEVVGGHPTGFIHSTGHGVGLEIHEAPSLGLRFERLQAGAIVTVEPGLYYPGLGGVRIEDTVLVTRNGAQILAACSRRLVIP